MCECKKELERLTIENAALKEGLDGWHSRCLDAEVERDAMEEQMTADRKQFLDMRNERDALAQNAERVRVYKQRYFEAIAERDALSADAERYRFIFAESGRVDPVCAVVWKKGNVRNSSEWVNSVGGEWLSKELDAAIGEKT